MVLVHAFKPTKCITSNVKGSLMCDGRGSSITTTESQPPCHMGPTTRAMARKLEEDWNTATNGRETYLYMLQEAKFLA